MKTLDRYFLGNLIVSTVFVTGAFCMAIWLTQSLRFLDMAVNGGAPLVKFLALVFLTLPNFIAAIFPVVLFIVSVHAYNRFQTDREALVAQCAGLSPFGVARAAIILGLLGGAVMLALNAHVAPRAQMRMKELRDSIRSEYAGVLVRKGVFSSFDSGITVFVRDRTPSGELHGIMMHEAGKNGKPVTVLAKRGALIETESGPRALVVNGIRQEVDPETGDISQVNFDRYAFDLKIFEPRVDGMRWREASERTLIELFNPTSHPEDQTHAAEFRVEGHVRLAMPLMAMGLPIAAAATLLFGDFQRRGLSRRVLISVGLAILFEAAILGSTSIARSTPSLVFLVYSAALLPLAVSAILFSHKVLWTLPRRKPSSGGTVGSPTAPTAATSAS